MKKPTTYNLQPTTFLHGYSLIEVLIASGIFATVMVMVFATFSVNSNIRNQSQAIRDASISGRYAMEAIAREFRLANSYTLNSSDDITINTYDENGDKISRRYFVDECNGANANQTICVQVGSNTAQPLTSADINVASAGANESIFDDYNSGATPTMQPILHIEFTINSNLGKKLTDKFTQTLETSVTGRSYSGFNSSIPVEQIQ